MADNKGFGKEYKPDDFSKPAKEVGGDSKVFLYVGIAVIALVAILGSLYFFGGFGKSSTDMVGATINAYCVDSDGGYNRYTKGVTAGTYYLDYGEDEFVDRCAGEENKLTEYYCKNDLVVFTTEPCPEGMLCTDGSCTN
ncbi:hypothetical protein COV16_05470 [Candidatus Woesearchaeota archaeon CG10_big_fil_rev_8_21_14_0_10_34_8]|nr:MAG: hypothetical protein COV16_05470 [Candidatus Woesearchaeota archaeon CG10_big_fil_rev_8_21_14_0_10_34_8]